MPFVRKIGRRRRTTYRRKTGYRRSMRRSSLYSRSGRSEISSNLAVYANAFSTASTSPRIPDNKVYSSCGVRLQAVGEFVNDNTAPMEFLLFPGLNNALCAFSCTGGQVGDGTVGTLPFTNHAKIDLSTPGVFNQDPGTSIHKWRGVSCAMKVTLVNNSDENDGWFEAIRVQGSDTSGFALTEVAAGLAVIAAGAGPLPAINVGITNLVEHPTYITGKLRDIHKYMFQLNPQGSDHEFEILPRNGNIREATEAYLDNENFDFIYLRVHGRAGASTPTRLMIHTIFNQEIIYDEASTMVRYHGNTRGSAAMVAVARKRLMQNPASQRAAKRARTAYASYSY